MEVSIGRQEDDEPLLTTDHVERPDHAHRVLLTAGRGQRRDWSERVHAGVGPAGAGDARIGAEPAARLLGQGPLHRARARLDLPAVIVRAVVGQHQAEGRTSRGYRGGRWRPGLRAGTNVSQTTAIRRNRRMSIMISHENPGSTVGATWRLIQATRSKSLGS